MSLKVVSWTENTPVTPESLNALSSNIQWLNENKVTGLWFGDGNSARQQNVVLIGGNKVMGFNSERSDVNTGISFGNSFSPQCNPVVVASIQSTELTRLSLVIRGQGGATRPSHTGFVASVRALALSDAKGQKYERLKGTIRVSWMAYGWK